MPSFQLPPLGNGNLLHSEDNQNHDFKCEMVPVNYIKSFIKHVANHLGLNKFWSLVKSIIALKGKTNYAHGNDPIANGIKDIKKHPPSGLRGVTEDVNPLDSERWYSY